VKALFFIPVSIVCLQTIAQAIIRIVVVWTIDRVVKIRVEYTRRRYPTPSYLSREWSFPEPKGTMTLKAVP